VPRPCQQLGRRSATRFVLEAEIAERLTVLFAHDEAGAHSTANDIPAARFKAHAAQISSTRLERIPDLLEDFLAGTDERI
jgi:hypothetical protein